MSASSKNTNPYCEKDRVKFSDQEHWFYGNKGTVLSLLENSVFVKFDSGITVCTSFKNLVKIKKKKKV